MDDPLIRALSNHEDSKIFVDIFWEREFLDFDLPVIVVTRSSFVRYGPWFVDVIDDLDSFFFFCFRAF